MCHCVHLFIASYDASERKLRKHSALSPAVSRVMIVAVDSNKAHYCFRLCVPLSMVPLDLILQIFCLFVFFSFRNRLWVYYSMFNVILAFFSVFLSVHIHM